VTPSRLTRSTTLTTEGHFVLGKWPLSLLFNFFIFELSHKREFHFDNSTHVYSGQLLILIHILMGRLRGSYL
jgi:hypothetical protein